MTDQVRLCLEELGESLRHARERAARAERQLAWAEGAAQEAHADVLPQHRRQGSPVPEHPMPEQMTDDHHHLRQQFIRQRFPRGAVEVKEWYRRHPADDPEIGWVQRPFLVPVEKPPDPAHQGLRHVSLNKLLKDPRNIIRVDRASHDLHHNAINPEKIQPPPEAWAFAAWCGLEWRLERERAA